jgi:hypothetical protein
VALRFVTYSVEVNGNPLGDYAAFQGVRGITDFLTTVQEATKTTDVKGRQHAQIHGDEHHWRRPCGCRCHVGTGV